MALTRGEVNQTVRQVYKPKKILSGLSRRNQRQARRALRTAGEILSLSPAAISRLQGGAEAKVVAEMQSRAKLWVPTLVKETTEAVNSRAKDLQTQGRALTKTAVRDTLEDALSAWSSRRLSAVVNTEVHNALQAILLAAIAASGQRKQWISERDSHVRIDHRKLDGQIVDVSEEFRLPGSSLRAMRPGSFGRPEQDIGCRCTVVPYPPKGDSKGVWKALDRLRSQWVNAAKRSIISEARKLKNEALRKLPKTKKAKPKPKPKQVPGRTYDETGRDTRSLEERRIRVRIDYDPDRQGPNTDIMPEVANWKPEDYADLVGAPDGAFVNVTRSESDVFISASWSDPDDPDGKVWQANRTITYDTQADFSNLELGVDPFPLKIKHDWQQVRGFPRGTGLRIFGQQARTAQRLGIGLIETLAAGSFGDVMNGYYTWPRFGFDKTLNSTMRERYGVETLSELMSTPEGRLRWKREGSSVTVFFPLSQDSESFKMLRAYEREKHAKKKRNK